MRKKLIKRSERPVCPETGGHFKAKWGDSLNAERLAIFAEMPNKQLIQIFLPFEGKNGKRPDLVKIEATLTRKFGGVSTYRQSPVSGKWLSNGTVEQDELLVMEVVAGTFDARYWSNFRSDQEKLLGEEEILIRGLSITIPDRSR